MDEHESFEVTEYDPDDLPPAEKYSVIKQVMQDRKNDPETVGLPSEAFQVHLQGDKLKLVYHSFEMHLPSKIKEVEAQAEKALNELVKYLKKEFRKRTKKPLSLKEIKESRDYSINKVSLNERYYFVSWRLFEMKGEK